MIKIIDKIGMITSFTCAIHCMLLPILVTILPYLGMAFFVNETFEIIMLLISFILAILSLCLGFKIHRNKRMFFLFSFGISFLLLGRLIHENTNNIYGLIILFCGGILISASHYINRSLCNKCTGCATH